MAQTVFITGCSSGFGLVTARHFLDRGWNVVATMRTPPGDFGASDRLLVTRLDVQDPASIEAAVGESLARFGAIDVLINNAGFGLFGVFESTAPEKIREQFEVNVFGVMDVTRAFLPHFRERKAGVIINVSSGAGVFTLPALSLYCSSKFALEGFSESLSYELASQGITVKIVEPGGVLSTNFGQRGAAEAGHNESLPDYAEFLEKTQAVFAGLRGERTATSEDVAAVIFGAATDGSAQLRYVATADIEPLVKMRRETSEAEYRRFMLERFTGR